MSANDKGMRGMPDRKAVSISGIFTISRELFLHRQLVHCRRLTIPQVCTSEAQTPLAHYFFDRVGHPSASFMRR